MTYEEEITPAHFDAAGQAGVVDHGSAALTLLFAKGARPSAARVAALGKSASFEMSCGGTEEGGRAELVAQGLSLDLAGLSSAAPAGAPPHRHTYGLDGPELPPDLEAVCLTPGSHLVSGNAVLPVIRVMAGMAAALAGLGGVRAVCWRPAGTCIETALFVRMVHAWLAGRAFPSLGLTALIRGSDGSVHSDGLAFFTGQEIWLEAGGDETPAETAGLAARMINNLVEDGPIHSVTALVGPNGERLDAEPSFDRRTLRIWRRR